MAVTAEIGGRESVKAGLGHVDARQARAHGDDIGVIMFAGELCGKWLRNQGAAAGGVAVDGNGYTDA